MSTLEPVGSFTEDELRDLEIGGRIKDGMVTMPDPPKPEKLTVADATKLDPSQIPAMPAGVKERLAAAKEIESSFVVKEGDKIVASSKDGGAAAAAAVSKPVNLDWADKEIEDPIEWDDKMKFMATMLGARHFQKTYSLFDGKLRVTFRTLTANEERECSRQAWNDDAIDGPGGAPGSEAAMAARSVRLTNYEFAGSLVSMEVEGDVEKNFSPFQQDANVAAGILPIRLSHEELLKMPIPVLMAIQREYHRFRHLTLTLTAQAATPGFWKAATAT